MTDKERLEKAWELVLKWKPTVPPNIIDHKIKESYEELFKKAFFIVDTFHKVSLI
jgi:hypothetical protein